MPTIDIYATGQSLTFLPSERAERIVLEAPSWWRHSAWDYRIDFTQDRAISSRHSVALDPSYLLNYCRQIASEKPSVRWARKEETDAAQPQS